MKQEENNRRTNFQEERRGSQFTEKLAVSLDDKGKLFLDFDVTTLNAISPNVWDYTVLLTQSRGKALYSVGRHNLSWTPHQH